MQIKKWQHIDKNHFYSYSYYTNNHRKQYFYFKYQIYQFRIYFISLVLFKYEWF